MSSNPAQGRVALVTGAGQRIGNFVARALAARGYRVALHARRSLAGAQAAVDEIQRDGGQALAVAAELADEQAVKTMIDQVRGHFGRIDALVNCAAIWKEKPLEQVTAEDVRSHFESNTLSTFLCCQHAGLAMAAQSDGGAIVNFGDWAVARPYLNYAAYFPSKGAIPTLTRAMAVELAARNPRVRVNAILPGPVLLPADLSDQERDKSIAGTLLKREGAPANVADAVAFLLENDYITGVCLPVDGGRSVFPG